MPGLTQGILTKCMEQLRDLNPNYKYIGKFITTYKSKASMFIIPTVTCTLLQKGETSAGLHTQSSCLWDTTTDGLSSHSC